MLTDVRVRVTWFWSEHFLLESDEGQRWVWSDPDYGGDNTLRPYSGTYESFCADAGVASGRCKGQSTIDKFCGKDVKILTAAWVA